MKIWVKHIALSFTLIFLLNLSSFAQFLLYNEAPVDISTRFTRQTIESAAKQTFFNALIIKNNSNRQENFTLNFTVPEGWTVIGGDKIEINLPPLDSITVPLRVAIGSNVRGDIGYNVIASLTDTRGNTIKNEYCFVKIPRTADLTIRYSNRIFYLDPTSKSAEFSVSIHNKGNREELINFLFDGNSSLTVGEQREALFTRDVSIPPHSDSLLTFRVSLADIEQYGRTIFGLKSMISSIDTVYQTNLWFKLIKSTFVNQIPSNEIPLSISAYAQGIADPHNTPVYTLNLEGKLLFNGDKEIGYYYRNFSSRKPEDLYLYNKMHIRGQVKNWTIELGDGYRNVESSMMGRGGYLAYDNPKIKAELIATRNLQTDVDNLGSNISYRFTPEVQTNLGLAYNESRRDNFNSKLVYVGTRFTLFNQHNLYLQSSYNLLDRQIDNKSNHNEYGWQMYYTSNIGNVSTSIRARSASAFHYSPYAGRVEVFGSMIWRKNQDNQLQVFYNENTNQFATIQEETIVNRSSLSTRDGYAQWRHFITPEVEIFAGPAVTNYQNAGLRMFPEGRGFSSLNVKAVFGTRIKNQTSSIILTPTFELAQARILDNPFATDNDNNKHPLFHHLSLTLRSRNFTTMAYYTSGPRSSYDQIKYLQTSIGTRKIQFLPTFEFFIYKDIVKLQTGMSYANDMIAKSTYTTLHGQINCYFPNNIEVQVLGVYSMQNRLNQQDAIESYQNLYLEFGAKKDFALNQPRVKYHNINIVFFKDYNGNFIQESNEPGIKSVLLEIEKVDSEIKGKIPGDFHSSELISDNIGVVRIEKIPEGTYKFNYTPLGADVGTYSKAIEETEIRIDRSGTYYFPFVEKNKVFGKIILNRSRLSGLGRIDVSNVRITATDSQGRSYSTLTDKNGEFVLFAPITDEYIVSINNIFYENFDLRQNSFLVQFNGYKQFEVNFVFDEKVRRINFAATDQEMQQGVQQVRRTTISGSVKDANTQQPIRARVNLINTRTNAIVASVNSSATSGDYTLNFMASDDYLLEVLADDYWYFSENLVLQQVTTFMNINRNIQLKPISVGSSIELNIQFGPNSDYLAPESVAELNRLLRQVRNNPTVRLEIQGHCDDLEAIQKPDIGRDRAGAVAKYLIENGFSNVEVKDMKNQVPLTSNDTEEGRARNRRIDVVVLRR